MQRRGKPAEPLGVTPGDAPGLAWTLDASVTAAPGGAVDVRAVYCGPSGRQVQLPQLGARLTHPGTFAMFRRAKPRLDAVSPEVPRSAAEQGRLVARVTLAGPSGNPVCASVRPPLIEWPAAPG